LLVDGDCNLEKCTINLNGIELKEKLISTMHFDSEHYALFDQLRPFGSAMRICVDDFRQWRAVPVAASLINWHGKNKIVLSCRTKWASVYADRRRTRYALSPDYCNYGLLAASPLVAGAESRYTDPVLTAGVRQASFLMGKTGVREAPVVDLPGERTGESSLKGLSDSLRVRFLVVPGNRQYKPADSGTAAAGKPAAFKIDVRRDSFDRMLWDCGSSDCLRINKVILYSAATVAAQIPLPAVDRQSHLKICIKGELRALKNPGEVGLFSALKGENGRVQILGKNPRALVAASNWRKFEIDDLVPLAALGGKAVSCELALYPCPWMESQYGVSRRATDAVFRGITIELSPAELPCLSRQRIIY
jgi:hypothetical protein